MKITVTTFLLILAYFTSFSQIATIKGRVYSQNEGGISHASIRLANSNIATLADNNGYFTLKKVPYGQYDLVVSSVEIETRSIKINVNQAHTEIPVVVKHQSLDLAEVNVVQKTEKREIETSGFAVNIIETKDIAQRNVQTNEMLDRTVGIRVRQMVA
ncbi:beta-sandwich domain-containing protein [Flectobacillus sp. BAB-3569]|uniref:beta-sandwich domain-containing protein n=1 Tax=Flectobacillus sp. BAB-3569 TaxID=1509483 RepID=UPI001E640C22|nr:DUF2012 domain-containing protein [Flectobacillus sp. BAB-3569]